MRRLGWVFVLCAAPLTLDGCAAFTSGSSVPAAPSARVPATASIAIYATGADEKPLSDALIYLHAVDAPAAAAPMTAPAAIDLMQRSFEPRVLAVPVGTAVTLHNLDDVNHDVYSFSPALPFSLRLTAQGGSGAVSARHAGLVVLGCKVHEEMVGYLYVTDAPYFGKTDANGYLRLAGLAPGRYILGVWRPEAPERDEPHLKPLTLAAGTEEAVRLRL